MNIVHCNDCRGVVEVSHVTLTATRIVAANEEASLGKHERVHVEGDLCATCLKVMTDSIREEPMPENVVSLSESLG